MQVIDFGRPVGKTHPPFIIAALDCRELATLDRALAAIDAAADSQCDAIKLAGMPWKWSTRLYAHAEQRGIAMLAPALDEDAINRLDWLGAPAFYLVYDWSDLELVARAARTGKPIVLHVGTASAAELAEVVATARKNGTGGIALVQSVIDVELDGLDSLRSHGAVVGISDRSQGPAIALAAISRGASIVEKRLALGRDGRALFADVASIVRDCEVAWASVGTDRRWVFN